MLADRLAPLHRRPLDLPRPWPACAQGLLREGAQWLHGEGWGGDLLALPGGSRLESRRVGEDWITTMDGCERAGRPFDILASVVATGTWIGALSFELAAWEAGLPHQKPEDRTLGMAWQRVNQAIYYHDGKAEWWSWEATPLEDLPARLAQVCTLARPKAGPLRSAWDQSVHHAAVETIRERILDGEFYVANLCVPFEAAWSGDEVTLALSALRRAEAPFGAFLPLGDLTLLCLSMERVLSRSGDVLNSEPIKGSAPRIGDKVVDTEAGAMLLADPKEIAEHTMIVDLVRNDLGRVAMSGSVRVAELLSLRAYPTVQHLVSRVEAKARPDSGLAEIFRAVLPGGSVTGAPKHAVCAHLARAEAAPRGFYCGALGWIRGADFDLALPIRTAQIQPEHLIYWAGGGITLRSEPAKEWGELHLKTKVMGLS